MEAVVKAANAIANGASNALAASIGGWPAKGAFPGNYGEYWTIRFAFAAACVKFFTPGRVYGPNHEEVGGVFIRAEIAGAFGAKRQQASTLMPRPYRFPARPGHQP